MGWWLVMGVVTLLLMGLVAWAMRIAARRRLYGSMYGLRSGAAGDWGLSVLLAQGADEEQVAALLTTDYERYEVVVALDGAQEAALLRVLQTRYRLIRVDCRPTDAFAASPITALYRSRLRLFRRLVVVDMRGGGRRERLDVVAEVATYELLLPLSRGYSLRDGAVAWLVAEADRAEGSAAESWVLCSANPVTCYLRSALARVGGFGRAWRLRRQWLPAGVVRNLRQTHRGACVRWGGRLVFLGVAGVAVNGADGLTIAAVAGSVLAWWLLLRRLRRTVNFETESHDWSFCRALRDKTEEGV